MNSRSRQRVQSGTRAADRRARDFSSSIVFIDYEKLAERRGYLRTTTSAMTEAEVREFFEKGGQPASDVKAMFRIARDTYRATTAV